MASNGPLTLEQVRLNLQQALNRGDEATVKYYIQILERLKVQVNYTETTEEDFQAQKKNQAKELLVRGGLSKAEAQSIINMNEFKPNESAEMYAERLLMRRNQAKGNNK